ncbi:MAG TPA: cation-transporting P-type ATPase, partial [Myxococcales bacterium]|nr:cation-transporting P-type ATPase [Myxococcales bacterium]
MLREALADVRIRVNGSSGARPAARGRAGAAAGAELREAAGLGADEVLRAQDSSAAGLTAEAAEDRKARYGDNQVAHERPPAWYVHLWHGFANAFSALLAVLAAVSWATGDRQSAGI